MEIVRSLALSFGAAVVLSLCVAAYRLWKLHRSGIKVNWRSIHFRWK